MMKIKHADGSIRDAQILTLSGANMRVAIQGGDDVAELRMINGIWFSEELTPVSFEFPWGPDGWARRGAVAYASPVTADKSARPDRIPLFH